MLISSELKKNLDFIFFRYRHILVYILIGLFSVFVELLVRKQLHNLGLEFKAGVILSISIGILVAFVLNIKLNFYIPKHFLLRSLLYFVIISFLSGCIQLLIYKFISLNILGEYKYESNRIIISGMVFLLAYYLHRKITFREHGKVGVAIYAKRNENTHGIFQKIGVYPDFIHVDVVDDTFIETKVDQNFYQFDMIKAYWKNHKIFTHLMTKKPSLWIDKVAKYSDIIFIHWEISEDVESIKNKIIKSGSKPGIVLHAVNDYSKKLNQITSSFAEIMILSIEKAGYSGQKFYDGSYKLINLVNNLKNRNKFNLHIDGGINEENIKSIDAQYIVSGSTVLNNENPRNAIMVLKTFGKYIKDSNANKKISTI
jgi:ribulose-phosphate 3-epimerase